jgi:flavin reductase ActVB
VVDGFREAMASFPSGTTIVTTSDTGGGWWGFTASSFCSVSLDPPLVLTCLATGARCFAAFAETDRWNIHVLQRRHAGLAMRFATRGADKFGDSDFAPDSDGVPVLPDASVWLRCSAHSRVEAGDHLILVGRVEEVGIGPEPPMVYFRRGFHSLELPADDRAALGSDLFELGVGWG